MAPTIRQVKLLFEVAAATSIKALSSRAAAPGPEMDETHWRGGMRDTLNCVESGRHAEWSLD